MKLYYDRHGIVRVASTTPIITNHLQCVDVEDDLYSDPIGKKVVFNQSSRRLAVICNWGDSCGIATYSRYLLDAIRPKVDAIQIFAEDNESTVKEEGVQYCWKRGQSMLPAIQKVLDWKPTVVLIQHEYGIFPKAPHLLQMLEMLSDIPYAVTMHSVYEHLDKTVCSAAMRHIIVHSETGRDCLRRLGHVRVGIDVIPHGCVRFDDVQEYWNITQTPYAMMQLGFGFNYKGVDVALKAIALLKQWMPNKYGGETPLHYLYLCSESPHTKNINNSYYYKLRDLIDELHLQDNVVIIRGYQPDNILNNYLRTYKLAIFPYQTDPRNVVYGASGAIRIAMANKIPTVASASRMFDDLEGVLPRPSNANQLAIEIDEVFSNSSYRQSLVSRAEQYINGSTWDITADRYVRVFDGLLDKARADTIVLKDGENSA